MVKRATKEKDFKLVLKEKGVIKTIIHLSPLKSILLLVYNALLFQTCKYKDIDNSFLTPILSCGLFNWVLIFILEFNNRGFSYNSFTSFFKLKLLFSFSFLLQYLYFTITVALQDNFFKVTQKFKIISIYTTSCFIYIFILLIGVFFKINFRICSKISNILIILHIQNLIKFNEDHRIESEIFLLNLFTSINISIYMLILKNLLSIIY
ncbi:hypothetical protein A0H76_2500 [Hepatospora eriocheir]|uniref:Uncharacterized protein n=1 Tax=Hepatospora eriocheir TaxID=1081669 RepID=A0A1X0QJR0_9MICR|nr:hypothetical protein A0H76_2500 [Hepatospora eriocheir]